MKTMEVAELQTNIVAIMQDVETHQEVYTFISGGVPVAKLEPVASKVDPLKPGDDPFAIFRFPGGGKIVGDLKPLYSDEELEEFFQASMAQFDDPS